MDPLLQFSRIVFYDGECGFCNSAVRFILSKKKKDCYFIPLQSEWAKEMLAKSNVEVNMDTIFFLQKNKLYDRSSAALQICLSLKGVYPLLFAFYIIPKFLRDPFYTFIAKRRHKLRKGYCISPSSEEKKWFIADANISI